MDKLLGINRNKGTKQTKPKIKKPVKVVYIANPIKVKTSASEFRALVQELTGRHDGVIRRRSDEELCPGTVEMPKVEDISTGIASPCTGSSLISYAEFDVLNMPQVMHDSNLWC